MGVKGEVVMMGREGRRMAGWCEKCPSSLQHTGDSWHRMAGPNNMQDSHNEFYCYDIVNIAFPLRSRSSSQGTSVLWVNIYSALLAYFDLFS